MSAQSLPDPSERQRQASDPDASVWVSANAGSGKTKVLVDRLLRLLLRGEDPSHILCLTYTKNGAAEMLSRMIDRSRKWVRMPQAELTQALHTLTRKTPDSDTCLIARRIFLQLSDAMPGLRILTIHAFCQSVLEQFPQEAGIAAGFSIIDDREQTQLLYRAKRQLLRQASNDTDSRIASVIRHLTHHTSEYGFDEIITMLIQHQRLFLPIIYDPDTRHASITQLYCTGGLSPETTADSLAIHYLGYDHTRKQQLLSYADKLDEFGAKTDQTFASHLRYFLNQPFSGCAADVFASNVLTAKHTINKRFPTKAIQAHPDVAMEVEALARCCEEYRRDRLMLDAIKTTIMLYDLAAELFVLYRAEKLQHNQLDYDDLITYTQSLLEQSDTAAWVLYRLDGRINHLLIDEAQDTSDRQWRITKRLCEEFYATQATQHRTLFVVGDGKQSIFGFQGAAPQAFHQQEAYYRNQAKAADQPFHNVPMQTSFRSSDAILSLVDTIFKEPDAHHAVSYDATLTRHYAFREQCAGSVYLHPACATSNTATDTPDWQRADERTTPPSPRQAVIIHIADMIQDWLSEPRHLPATGKPIQPQDILILLRSRKDIAAMLQRALRDAGVPVGGQDRLTVTDHIAVQDLLAWGNVLLDTTDDASLAAILVSPLYRLNYDTLTGLCAGRDEHTTVWRALQTHHSTIVEDITHFRQHATWQRPSHLFTSLLYGHGAIDRYAACMGDGVRDVLQHFLYECQHYEATHPDASLQGFLSWMPENRASIKRNMQEMGNVVRIMTIHGAKGLEAPIVILPDTITTEHNSKDRLVYDDAHATPTIWYRPTSETMPASLKPVIEAHKHKDAQEAQRLLYVALTRACDELHLFASLPKKASDIPPDSWYHQIEHAMQSLDSIALDPETYWQQDGLQAVGQGYAYHRHKHYAKAHQPPTQAPAPPSLPEAWTQPVAHLPETLHFAKPSDNDRPAATHSASANHVTRNAQEAIQRGILIHRALEWQTNQSYATFLQQLPEWLRHHASQLPTSLHHELYNTLAALHEHQTIVMLLEQPAMAEVPVIGKTQTHGAMSGQIDRLIVTSANVSIIDIKTGIQPLNESDITASYRHQMHSYRELLTPLYPTHNIQCQLLYVSTNPALLTVT